MEPYEILEQDFKVLADKTRLKVLHRIRQGEQCGCDLIERLDIKQPTLSHHLRMLSKHGFIVGTKEKNRICYKVNQEKINEICTLINYLIKEPINCESTE